VVQRHKTASKEKLGEDTKADIRKKKAEVVTMITNCAFWKMTRKNRERKGPNAISVDPSRRGKDVICCL
jgi:hypothetical protein